MMLYEERKKLQGQYSGHELSVSHSDPLGLEENLVKEKDKDIGDRQTQIKALQANEGLKNKAIEELRNEVSKLDEKLRVSEKTQEHKDLEIRKLTEEKNDALAAQCAAEEALRRLHMNQKDDEPIHLESFIAPLEAEIKMCKNEIAALQEDKKALERMTKSKESALIEAERILRSALERALIVEEVQNQNFDLRRQIEICQEENKILEKTNRQKVQEVEKLSQTIQELEEAILASGAAANAARDYQRQISQSMEEKRTLEREIARLKVSNNRVATVVANEWKDENDKVMPVKQWLEERKLLQAEMQRLRDKLAVSERTAKAEAQLKEKLKQRLKTLEEGLKHVSSYSVTQNGSCESAKGEKTNVLGFLSSNDGLKKRSTSQPRSSSIRGSILLQPNLKSETAIVASNSRKKHASGEMMLRKGIWASRSKVTDRGEKENEMQANVDMNVNREKIGTAEAEIRGKSDSDSLGDDVVSGFLYDRIQKEVINLRKTCEMKEGNLHAKDEEIKMLMKKIDALTKSIEVESKKMKREAAARDKEAASTKTEEMRKTRSVSARRGTKMY